MEQMTTTKKASLITTTTMALMFMLSVAQSVPSVNAVDTGDTSMEGDISPEQLQGILDSIGIDINLDTLPLSNPQGELDTTGQMFSQPPVSDDGKANEEQASEEEQIESIDSNDEGDDNEYEQDQNE